MARRGPAPSGPSQAHFPVGTGGDRGATARGPTARRRGSAAPLVGAGQCCGAGSEGDSPALPVPGSARRASRRGAPRENPTCEVQQDSPAPAASQPRLLTRSFILPLVRHSRTALPTRGREHGRRPAGQGTRALHRVLRLHSPRRLAATEPPVLTLERAHQRAALP